MNSRRVASANTAGLRLARDPWRDVLDRAVASGADDHAAAAGLAAALDGLDAAAQRNVIDGWLESLLRAHQAYGVTLFLLGRLTDPAALESLAVHLVPLPPRVADDEESHLADLIRVLAATGDAALLGPVESYLVARPIGPLWPTVPWALWPHCDELFVAAWARFFVAVAPARSTAPAVLEPFLAEPSAVRAVTRHLAGSRSTRWKRVRAAIAGLAEESGWLSPEQRADLRRSLL